MSHRSVRPSEEKIAAIEDALPPKDAAEAKSFLGLVQYFARFIPNMSSIEEPIQKMTCHGTHFRWEAPQQSAFEESKQRISSPDTLAYFKADCQTQIVVDASPVGVAAVLTQIQGGEWCVVSYASQSLSDVEHRYSQTEKEALALVWACERFNFYVFGRRFELETDHKLPEHIFCSTSVIYRPGKTNIADVLSQLNRQREIDQGEEFDYLRAIVEASVPVAILPFEIERTSAAEIQEVKQCVRSRRWDRCSRAYLHVKEEFGIYGELLMCRMRIAVPGALRDRVMRLAHKGHQRVIKMKNRLRTKVGWPQMGIQAERMCRKCHGCQAVAEQASSEPLARVVHGKTAVKTCLPTGESILVLIDYYSRYYEAMIMKSTTSVRIVNKIVDEMKEVFSQLVLPTLFEQTMDHSLCHVSLRRSWRNLG